VHVHCENNGRVWERPLSLEPELADQLRGITTRLRSRAPRDGNDVRPLFLAAQAAPDDPLVMNCSSALTDLMNDEATEPGLAAHAILCLHAMARNSREIRENLRQTLNLEVLGRWEQQAETSAAKHIRTLLDLDEASSGAADDQPNSGDGATAEPPLPPEEYAFLSKVSSLLATGDPKAFVVVVDDVIARMRVLADLDLPLAVKLNASAAAASLEVVKGAIAGDIPAKYAKRARVSLFELIEGLALLALELANPKVRVVVLAAHTILRHAAAHLERSG